MKSLLLLGITISAVMVSKSEHFPSLKRESLCCAYSSNLCICRAIAHSLRTESVTFRLSSTDSTATVSETLPPPWTVSEVSPLALIQIPPAPSKPLPSSRTTSSSSPTTGNPSPSVSSLASSTTPTPSASASTAWWKPSTSTTFSWPISRTCFLRATSTSSSSMTPSDSPQMLPLSPSK